MAKANKDHPAWKALMDFPAGLPETRVDLPWGHPAVKVRDETKKKATKK